MERNVCERFALTALVTMCLMTILHNYPRTARYPRHWHPTLRPPTPVPSGSNSIPSAAQDDGIKKYELALGIFSVERPPPAPTYVYIEVMSILDSLFAIQPFIHVDKVHIFDGTFNKTGDQVKFFKYTRNVAVHFMNNDDYRTVAEHPVHRKASLNYLLALRFLLNAYPTADAYLILEDDVLFDPDAPWILWRALTYAMKQTDFFVIDGYVRGPMRQGNVDEGEDVLLPFHGDERCCSQAFLLSPKAARTGVPAIEQSLNGSVPYLPLDLLLSSSLLQHDTFHWYAAKHCWVQHIGKPYLGLGPFHRGCSQMTFDD